MGDIPVSLPDAACPEQSSVFPPDDVARQYLQRLHRDINRSANHLAQSYDLRSAEPEDLAQEARIRVLRVLHRRPNLNMHFLRRVISRAARKEALRQRAIEE